MRVVLDVNVFVSALLSSKGAPVRILEHWQDGQIQVVVSPAILEELKRVLHYPKLQQRYCLPEETIQTFLRLIIKQAIVVTPETECTVVQADPTDDRYLECALTRDAQVIVSGDQHLLELGEYQDVQILTPAGFLALLKLDR
jgi:putative PIN family toxin of toxin-antitoxin system